MQVSTPQMQLRAERMCGSIQWPSLTERERRDACYNMLMRNLASHPAFGLREENRDFLINAIDACRVTDSLFERLQQIKSHWWENLFTRSAYDTVQEQLAFARANEAAAVNDCLANTSGQGAFISTYGGARREPRFVERQFQGWYFDICAGLLRPRSWWRKAGLQAPK